MANGPGPSVTKLNATVQAIEGLEAWNMNFKLLTRKMLSFLRLKIHVLEEKVQDQAMQIRYLEEVLEIEVGEGGEDMGTGDVAGNGISESGELGAEGVSGETGPGGEDGVVKSEDMFKISKDLGVSKQIRVSSIHLPPHV